MNRYLITAGGSRHSINYVFRDTLDIGGPSNRLSLFKARRNACNPMGTHVRGEVDQ